MDEADKLLDQGNEVKLKQILEQLPKQRRTGLFSATMPTQVKNLIKTGMRNPYVVEIKTEDKGIFASVKNTSSGVSIKSFDTTQHSKDEINEQINNISEIPMNLTNYFQQFDSQAEKLPGLAHFISSEIESSRIIIFFATCSSVNFHYLALQHIVKNLVGTEAEIYKLHGKIDQKKRSKIYSSFKQSKPEDG